MTALIDFIAILPAWLLDHPVAAVSALVLTVVAVGGAVLHVAAWRRSDRF